MGNGWQVPHLISLSSYGMVLLGNLLLLFGAMLGLFIRSGLYCFCDYNHPLVLELMFMSPVAQQLVRRQ